MTGRAEMLGWKGLNIEKKGLKFCLVRLGLEVVDVHTEVRLATLYEYNTQEQTG